MSTSLHHAPAARPLIVRLRNWIGDVILGVPALRLLAGQGYQLHLVGKPWAAQLLAGEGWPVHVLPKTARERVRQLRRLREQCRAADPGFDRRLNAVAFPFSFSSALEMRLAGLRAIGHAHEGRSLLLGRALPRRHGRHELEVYWELACALLGREALPPASIDLPLTAEHRAQAAQLQRAHGLQPGRYLVLCPFAGGTIDNLPKTWPAFPDFAASLAPLGLPLVLCPGPGEEEAARRDFPGCLVLEKVHLGAYGALLQDAAAMVSNDTGPGHLAAAVGTPTLSVLGPTDPGRWRPWGPQVGVLRGEAGGWPPPQAVMARLRPMLPLPLRDAVPA